MLYYQVQKRWTPKGKDYLEKLDNLTGVRYKRLRKGQWVSAEGLVWDTWDENIFAIYPFEIPEDWRRIRVIDFGYVNPFVCQWWALDNDDNMYLYKEIYMTGRTVTNHAAKILEESEGEQIEATICDHDAEDRATLEENGIPTMPAQKPITVGLQAVDDRMKVVNGKPRISFFRDAVLERDLELEDQKKPTSTLDEIPDFVWSNKGKELPIQVNDHGCDATRYATMYVDLYSGTGGIHV
jgi:phage terminase large subunit